MTLPLLPLNQEVSTSDDWYTPVRVFDALNFQFSIDVAAPPGGVPWVPADRYFTRADDGLAQDWSGTVWCNPPYSNPEPWITKLASHGDGIALVPGDTSTGLFHDVIVNEASLLCFIRGRLRFVRGCPDSTSARFSSVLVAFGPVASSVVSDAAASLGWVVEP